MPAPSQLPVKDGIGPTRLRVPTTGPWATIVEYVIDTFDHLAPAELRRRFDAGEIAGSDGHPIAVDAALGTDRFIWYYRDIPDEDPVPVTENIIHLDDDLVVIDKPHFLPTTPGGRFLRESALVRLRTRLNNPEVTPIHRLDRATAGLLMFSTRAETRGTYQSLFEKRLVSKVYEAVSALPPYWDSASSGAVPQVYRTHIAARRGELRVVVNDAREPNSETAIDVAGCGVSASGRRVLHTILRPHTGRKHQLRVHLAALGIGILGDTWYPDLQPEEPDDYALPLQLLAREVEFTDPVSGRRRRFRTGLALSEVPLPG